MDAPIPGATFALYCGGALVLVCLFGAYQLWRLFFSRELGTYAEIKWGGARPPKEYVDEMKKLEARRKRKFLRSVTDLWGVWVWCKHQRNQTQRDKRSNHEKSIACWFVKGKDPGPTTPFNIIQSYSIPSTWKGTMSFKIEDKRDKWMEHSYGRVSGQLLLWHFWIPKKSPKQPIKNSNKINTSTTFGNFQYIVFVVFFTKCPADSMFPFFWPEKVQKLGLWRLWLVHTGKPILNRWFPLRPALKPRSSWWFMWFHPYFVLSTRIPWGKMILHLTLAHVFCKRGWWKTTNYPWDPNNPWKMKVLSPKNGNWRWFSFSQGGIC